MKKSFFMIPLAALSLTGCLGDFGILGLNEKGDPVEAFVSEEAYTQHVKEMLASTTESVAPVLNEQSTLGNRWSLRSAVVGFGVKGEAGIGSFRVGLKPRFRVVFGKGDNPPIPY